MKNSADQGGCYPQSLKTKVDKTLQDLLNSIISLLFVQSISPFFKVPMK